MSPEKLTLEDVVRESRDLLDPELNGAQVDWTNVDDRLFARIGMESKTAVTEAALVKFAGKRAWGAVAAVLAIAAAVPMMFGQSGSSHRTSGMPLETAALDAAHGALSAGAFAWKEGAGDIQIGERKIAATSGSALVQGDAVEATRARGIFERSVNGKNAVTWAIEDASRISVKGTRGALVLGLERGAIEAQVTPVPSGEAFAVDVDAIRVAVHGTHLRVARDGSRVVVDLTEGIVSIGVPPRFGSTYGELVNAPAHIEFDANDVHGTLKVTHAPDRVRAALAFRPPAESIAMVPPRVQIPPPAPLAAVGAPAPRPSSPIAAANHATPIAPSVAAPPAASIAENGAPIVAQQAAPVSASGVSGGASGATSAPAAPQAARGDVSPEKAIADAIRACARTNANAHPEDVVITVTSRLELRVGAGGNVESARFFPPLNPEVQSCASSAIYKARFAEAGAVTIPLDFKR